MCFFPVPVKPNEPAYKYGVREYACGCCPECLSKKSRFWALRAVMQSRSRPACMVTLTYDNYVRDGHGRVVGERADTRLLSKEDAQKFIKRLRKHFSGVSIKYILTAERGKRTNRAHYHAILFGVVFPDLVPYKRSKRGNLIYKSATLDKIWKNGICTVDSINIKASVARYCTKYCAKDTRGADDTFMLFSRGIGDEEMLRNFNGRPYLVDGCEFPIPKTVWKRYFERKYADISDSFSTSYVGLARDASNLDVFLSNLKKRRQYRMIRDNDDVYKSYLRYYEDKNERGDFLRPNIPARINALDDKKYHNYKIAALRCYTFNYTHFDGMKMPPPRSSRFSILAKSLNLPRFSAVSLRDVVFDFYHPKTLCESFLPEQIFLRRDLVKLICRLPLVLQRQMTPKYKRSKPFLYYQMQFSDFFPTF